MKRPALTTPSTIEVPRAERRTLSNGVELHMLSGDDYQVTRVTFVFRAGSARQIKPFSAGAAANLMAEGSARMTGRQIAERLDFLGSYYDVSIDRDYVYLSFASLARLFAQTLDLAAEVLLRPVYPEKEVEAYRTKRRQQLAVERTKVDMLAREEFARVLFGEEHPYGVSYPESAYDELRRDDIVSFHDRFYRAGGCFAVCSGHVGPDECAAICRLAELLPCADSSPDPLFPAPRTRHEGFVSRPDAVQSSIRVGRLLFPRNHPDFVGMQVVAEVLGGYFGSRLMRNLREQHGYTYGVMAAMVNLEREGYLAIATQTGAEVTRQALNEIFRETERLRSQPVGDEELSLVKNMMTGEVMRILDGPFGIADVTIENILCGTDNGIIEENLRRIREITPEEILRLAQRYLAREDLVTVVAGPCKV